MRNPTPFAVAFIAVYNLVNGLVSVWLGIIGVFFFPFMPDMDVELFESYFHFLLGVGLLTSALGLWRRQGWSRQATLVVLLVPALLTPLWLTDANTAALNQLIVIGSVIDVFLLILLWNKAVGEWIKQ